MTKNEISKIIKQGTVKRQTLLYYSDIASFNVKGNSNQILTDKDRDIIWNNIKTDKEVKYYNELRDYNKVFLSYKPQLELVINTIYNRFEALGRSLFNLLHTENLSETINDLLEDIKDPEDRDKALKKAVKQSKRSGAIIYREQGEGSLDWFDLDYKIVVDIYSKDSYIINNQTEKALQMIQILTEFTNKYIPLKPYKDYIKEQTDKLKEFTAPLNEVFYGRLNTKNLVIPLDKHKQLTQERIEEFIEALIKHG